MPPQLKSPTDPGLRADTYARHVRPLDDTVAEVLERAVARGELAEAPEVEAQTPQADEKETAETRAVDLAESWAEGM